MNESIETKNSACSVRGPQVLCECWACYLALGLTMIVVGTLAMALPMLAGLGVVLLLGWLLMIGGLVQALHAFGSRRWSGFLVQLTTAVLYVIVGYFVVRNPLASMFALTVLLAAFLLVEGFFRILLAFQLRPAGNWGWVATSGIVAAALAVMIWTGLPGDSFVVLGLLVGVNMVFNGVSTAMLAWAAHNTVQASRNAF